MKIAAVSYLNALPLIEGLDEGQHELSFRVPSQLRSLLDQADVALLPLLNYFEDPSLYLIPGLCIGCRGAVESVKLFSQEPIEKVSRIYLDSDSRSSQNLLKVLLKEKYGRNLNEVEFTADKNTLASLLIGDKAILNPPQTKYEYDLGKEWTEWQKLPFVFALWMSQKDLGKEASQTLQNSFRKSLQNIDELVEKHHFHWDKAHLKHYFTQSINYVLGEEDLKGIKRFFELLKPIQGFSHELHFRFVSEN